MPWSLFDIVAALPVYALVLFRLTGMMLVAPVYGSTVIPLRIRVALAMTVAAMVFPLVSRQAPADLSIGAAIAGGVGEVFIGLSIGLALMMLLSAAEVAGLFVGQQSGLALAEVFNPALEDQSSLVGQLYSIVFLLVFLLVGGHRATLSALLDTFGVIPLLRFTVDEPILLLLIELLTAAFVLGIRLAAPAVIALFLTETALGFLSRSMPQLNILTVGFSVRVLVALLVAGVTLAACGEPLVDAVYDGLDLVRSALGLAPSDGGAVG